MLKVAMLSFWHVHARDYARQAEEHPETEIAAVWDEVPERGRREAGERGVPFFESLEEVLAQDHIDGVIVDAPSNMHAEVMVRAARAGKHIFTEKVLATTLKEARQILDAVEQSGVKLTVSLPRLNDGYTLAIREILREELLGRLTLARVRLSHSGALRTPERPNGWLPEHFYNKEQCGGGALIDLGCHPMYLTRLFLGMPEAVSAQYGYVTGREVEDNAVATLRYASGAVGVVEAGFVNPFSPFSIELHGTEGSLFYGTPEAKLLLRSSRLGEKQWTLRDIPPNRESAFRQWVKHIRDNTVAEENIAIALDLTRLMEASNRSAASGRSVRIDELAVR